MDPYEEKQHEYAELRGSRIPPPIYEAWMRLQIAATDKLPRTIRHRKDELAAKNPIKSSRIAEFVRKRPQLPKPAKAGIGLVALLATVVGGLLWRRRKRK